MSKKTNYPTVVSIRLTAKDKSEIEKMSYDSRKSKSEFLRDQVMNILKQKK